MPEDTPYPVETNKLAVETVIRAILREELGQPAPLREWMARRKATPQELPVYVRFFCSLIPPKDWETVTVDQLEALDQRGRELRAARAAKALQLPAVAKGEAIKLPEVKPGQATQLPAAAFDPDEFAGIGETLKAKLEARDKATRKECYELMNRDVIAPLREELRLAREVIRCFTLERTARYMLTGAETTLGKARARESDDRHRGVLTPMRVAEYIEAQDNYGAALARAAQAAEALQLAEEALATYQKR